MIRGGFVAGGISGASEDRRELFPELLITPSREIICIANWS
jgi:hypothetical protein